MPRFRRRTTHIGRTEYQLRLPYPAANGPEAFFANFRELERWGNALPAPERDSFNPYWVYYESPEPDDGVWDIDLMTLIQEKYDINYIPLGLWMVYASIYITEVPAGTVGGFTTLSVVSQTTTEQTPQTFGYVDTDQAIRVVKNIDFTAETVEYEWVLPEIGNSTLHLSLQSRLTLRQISAGYPEGLGILGWGARAEIIDPDVGPDITSDIAAPTILKAWARRMSDAYDVPGGGINDITPP